MDYKPARQMQLLLLYTVLEMTGTQAATEKPGDIIKYAVGKGYIEENEENQRPTNTGNSKKLYNWFNTAQKNMTDLARGVQNRGQTDRGHWYIPEDEMGDAQALCQEWIGTALEKPYSPDYRFTEVFYEKIKATPYPPGPLPPLDSSGDDPEETSKAMAFFEGERYSVILKGWERDKSARADCIKRCGAVCAACAFDFQETYGEIGETLFMCTTKRRARRTRAGTKSPKAISFRYVPTVTQCSIAERSY